MEQDHLFAVYDRLQAARRPTLREVMRDVHGLMARVEREQRGDEAPQLHAAE